MLQSIAAENNLAETAFLRQHGSHFELRWFTPTVEMDLCGHATLASAHVVFHHLGYQQSTVQFKTVSGILKVSRLDNRLTLDFPARPAAPCETLDSLSEAIGAKPISLGKSRDYLAVFETESDVRNLAPNMAALSHIDCLGVIATAPGDGCDFVSRFFAPRAGIPEDPVTGAAHCTLIPYWAHRLGRTTLRALQVSARGGELFCEHHGDRVGIGGSSVTYSSGFLHVLDAQRSA